MTPRLRLYTKSGCHLCEQAEADLGALRMRHPHTLELIDISADAALLRQYGERIPVLEVSGHEYAAPLDRNVIERALAAAEATAAAAAKAAARGGAAGQRQ